MEFVERSTTNLLLNNEREHSSGSINEGRWDETESPRGNVIRFGEVGITDETVDEYHQSMNQFPESDDLNISESTDFKCMNRAIKSLMHPVCFPHASTAPETVSLREDDKLHNETANIANFNSDLRQASAEITQAYAYEALDQGHACRARARRA